MQYFGERWDAPAFEDAVQVPVPVGETCLLCTEVVEEGDSGILMPYFDGRRGHLVPTHIECHLRSVRGSVAHLEGRCSCNTGRKADDRSASTYREEARAVLAWLHARDTS